MSALWYATRATGEVALLFLTVVLALGVLSALRVGGVRVPRFVIAGLHRNLTLAGIGFLVVHILTAVADSFAPISLADALIPFASAYRPIWLGLGTFAFDVLIVLTVTSLLRTRLGYRRWKALHWAAYGCWLVAFVHALGTGSDVRSSLFLLFAGVCAAVVLVAVGGRLATGGPDNLGLRVGSGLLTLLMVVVVGAWTVSGPLAPGWARRSGTPAAILGHGATSGGASGRGATGNAPATTTPSSPAHRGQPAGGDDGDGGDRE